MDAYTRRIVIRLGWKANGDKYTCYQQFFESKFGTPDIGMWGDFHAHLDGHAARVCRKLNPLRESAHYWIYARLVKKSQASNTSTLLDLKTRKTSFPTATPRSLSAFSVSSTINFWPTSTSVNTLP